MIEAILEAKNDASHFVTLSGNDRTIFIINKMKDFNNRFGVGNCTNYLEQYVKSLAKELKKKMDKEKELEDMTAEYEKAQLSARVTIGSMNKGEADWYCRHLQNAGYGNVKQAVKEFAEKLKEKAFPVMRCVPVEYIDELIKELYGEKC